jgi:PTS system mannose-specific IIB component/fructoselysine and glucoselysine-specific PTS system IIB component
MPIVLHRIDERLIHGQVVVGWGSQLHPDRIVVVDDDLSASTWEQELYVLGLPPEITAEFTNESTPSISGSSRIKS